MRASGTTAGPSRRRKVLMAAAGAAIGLAAGAIAAAFTIILLAAVAWLFVFGDDPWPRWSDFAIPAVGYAVALAAIVTGAVIGWRSATPRQ